MIVISIHGNAATPSSFNLIKMCIPEHTYVDLSYNSANGFNANLKAMFAALSEYPDETFFFVSHSLGGVYAGHLATLFPEQAVGIVSMATPYGGSEAATVLNMFAPCQLFSDIKPTSLPIRKLARSTIPCHLTAIVTTAGQSSLWQKANDGIVSKESMYARPGAHFIEVDSGHHEICLSMEAVAIIREAIENVMEEA